MPSDPSEHRNKARTAGSLCQAVWNNGARCFAALALARAAGPLARVGAAAYVMAVAALCAVLLLLGLRMAPMTNPDERGSDQLAYIGLAQEMRGSWVPSATDGTRNPLVSWLAGNLLDPNTEDFFPRAKRLSILWAVLGTGLLGGYFGRRLPLLPAWNLTALSGLGVLLPISTFFIGEVLLYPLFFAVWVLCLRLLRDNPVGAYAALAVAAAAAWLAKPSTDPTFVIFWLLTFAAALTCFLFPRAAALLLPRLRPANCFWGLLVFAALYLLLLTPRMIDAQDKFGDPLHNISRHTFWLEDWESGFPILGQLRPDRIHRLAPEDRPTAANYLRRHGWDGVWQRLSHGVGRRLEQLFLPEGGIRFLGGKRADPGRVLLPNRGFYQALVWGGALLALVAAVWKKRLRPAPWLFPALFATGCFSAYLLAMGWFYPVGPGDRFIMMFYIPLLWTGAAISLRVAADTDWRPLAALLGISHALIAALLLAQLGLLLRTWEFDTLKHTF